MKAIEYEYDMSKREKNRYLLLCPAISLIRFFA